MPGAGHLVTKHDRSDPLLGSAANQFLWWGWWSPAEAGLRASEVAETLSRKASLRKPATSTLAREE